MKRSRRLMERSVEGKENQGKAGKRKKITEFIKPNSGGKDAIVKPIHAQGRSMVNVKEKDKKEVKAKEKVTSTVLKTKETAGKEVVNVKEKLVKLTKSQFKDEEIKKISSNIKPKDPAGKDELKATVKLTSGEDDVDIDTSDAEENSADDVVNVEAKLVKMTKNQFKDAKKMKTSNNIKPKYPAGKDEVKATVKPTNETEGETSSEDDVNIDTSDAEEDLADDVVNVETKLVKETKNKFEDEKEMRISSNIEPKYPVGTKPTVKPTNETEGESSSGDDVDIDTSDAEEDSADDVVNVETKLVKETKNKFEDEKEMRISSNIEPKYPAGKDEVKPTNGTEGESSSEDDVDIDTSDAEEDSADDVVNVETELVKETKNQLEDEKEMKIPSNFKPKEASGIMKMKEVAGNIKPKGTTSKDDVKNIVKPTDEKEDKRSSGMDDVDMEMNEGRIFKIMSRIEYKLDGLVCEQVQEKRMFAILLRMPFNLANDVIQYNLDLGDVNLFLKFAKYFENVGGKSNGKKVCNILHKIATPNVLGSFDWQKSSPDSFQKFENIVRLIHTAAMVICSPYDQSLGGEIIKTALRNARGSRN